MPASQTRTFFPLRVLQLNKVLMHESLLALLFCWYGTGVIAVDNDVGAYAAFCCSVVGWQAVVPMMNIATANKWVGFIGRAEWRE